MKEGAYRDSYEGMKAERRNLRIGSLILAAALFVALIVIAGKDETVVLIPPGLAQTAAIHKGAADVPIKEAWGAYVATALGNVTPGTADFVSDALNNIIDPTVYSRLSSVINKQATLIKEERVSVSFAVGAVFYDPTDDVVIVSGEYTLRGLRENSVKQSVRTFEIGLTVRNYRVTVTSIDVYEGAWRSTHSAGA